MRLAADALGRQGADEVTYELADARPPRPAPPSSHTGLIVGLIVGVGVLLVIIGTVLVDRAATDDDKRTHGARPASVVATPDPPRSTPTGRRQSLVDPCSPSAAPAAAAGFTYRPASPVTRNLETRIEMSCSGSLTRAPSTFGSLSVNLTIGTIDRAEARSLYAGARKAQLPNFDTRDLAGVGEKAHVTSGDLSGAQLAMVTALDDNVYVSVTVVGTNTTVPALTKLAIEIVKAYIGAI